MNQTPGIPADADHPDPDRSFRYGIAAAGLAVGFVNTLIGLLLSDGKMGTVVLALLLGLPAWWAAGACWLPRPRDQRGRYTRNGAAVMAASCLAVATSSLLTVGLVCEVMGVSDVMVLVYQTGSFFVCCGWPAGVVCAVAVLSFGSRWVMRAVNGEPDHEAVGVEDHPTTEGESGGAPPDRTEEGSSN